MSTSGNEHLATVSYPLIGKLRAAAWRLSMRGLARGPHITRYFMYQRLHEVGTRLPLHEGDVLSISHSQTLCDVLAIRSRLRVETTYPEDDFLALRFADASFDFVLSDQVLEHIEGDPQKAIDESRRVLRPGGIAVHTTCFINPIHDAPSDYWRFTPAALRFLSRDFARVLECGGWGNLDAWGVVRDGLRFDGIPHARWHPLHRLATRNDPAWPIVTWVVAQK